MWIARDPKMARDRLIAVSAAEHSLREKRIGPHIERPLGPLSRAPRKEELPMRKVSLAASVVVAFALVAGCSSAGPGESLGTSQEDLGRGSSTELNNPLPGHMPTQDRFARELGHSSGGAKPSGSNLSYHGGPTITSAHVVAIFWGSSWSPSDPISTSLSKYIASYGGSGEYHVITQYYSGSPAVYIQSTNLAGGKTTVWYDPST
jgi:hypothetical protein